MKEHQLESSMFDEHPEDEGRDGGQRAPTAHASPQQAGSPRSGGRRATAARRRRRRAGRRFVVLLVALAVVAGAGYLAMSYLKPVVAQLTESDDYEGAGTGSASVVIHAGDSGRTIGTALQKAGVVKTAKAFSDAAEANPEAGSIQPGSYTVRTGMSAAAAVDMLLDPANRTVPRATIREGLWRGEVFAALSDATGRPVAEYQAAARDPAALRLPASAKGNLEGYLFPASYDFDPEATAGDQLRTLVAKTVAELDELGVDDAHARRVVTIASIVESEASRAQDRPKVARVVENRLAAKMPLQMDSSVHYMLQKRGKAGTTDAERATRNPYNTYLNQGLPPGPIASPGAASLNAAAHPAAGGWKYFVAVDPATGQTRFADDIAGHRVNEKLFNQWCAAHKGRC